MVQVITPKTILLSDLDGTLLPLLPDPKARRIDPNAFIALDTFHKTRPGQVLPITGRDWMQVCDCFGGRVPGFPIVSSNGAALHLPDGDKFVEIAFPFSAKERIFIEEMRGFMIQFQKKHPDLVIEVKPYEVGFHYLAKQGHENVQPDYIQQTGDACLDGLKAFENEAKRRGLQFDVFRTDATHRAMNCARVTKSTVFDAFKEHLPAALRNADMSHVVYCGDCLREGGNDRPIAHLVREWGATLVQVTNNDPKNLPAKDDVVYPDYIFSTPQDLGLWLRQQVSQVVEKNVIHLHTPSRDAKGQEERCLRTTAAQAAVGAPAYV